MDAGKELNQLRQEVAHLSQYKKALDANKELMGSFISMSQSASGRLLTRALLQQTLQIATNLTQCEESSIFLLEPNGVIQECLLARGALIREQKYNLVGQVLKEGLAGWVYDNREIALIIDTRIDSRWINLPSQPYTTLSAICIPIIRGRSLLAIITLTHSEAAHFTQEMKSLMEIIANQIALVFDQMRFYVEKKLIQATSSPQDNSDVMTKSALSSKDKLSEIGTYIINYDGKFIYADPKFAEIFGYTLNELVGLKSFFSLAMKENRDALQQRVEECFNTKNLQISVKFQGKGKTSHVITIKLHGRRTKLFGQNLLIGFIKGN